MLDPARYGGDDHHDLRPDIRSNAMVRLLSGLKRKRDALSHNYLSVLVLLGSIAFSLLLYGRVLPSYFLSDDFEFIGYVHRYGKMAVTDGPFLRPVSQFTYAQDYFLWKLNPFGFHLTNILLHGINGFLLYVLLRRLLLLLQIKHASSSALASAGLFLALSCHSEVVAWIAGRTDAVVTLLGLGATVYLVNLISKRSLGSIIGFLSFFLMALFAKENAIILPLVWTVLEATYLVVRNEKPAVWHFSLLGAVFTCVVAYLIVRWLIMGHIVGGYGAGHLSYLNFSTLIHGFIYTVRALVPPLPPLPRSTVYAVTGAILALVAVVLFVVRRRLCSADGLIIGAFGLCFYVSLLPALTMPASLFSMEGERHLYMPSLFLCSLLPLMFLAVSRSLKIMVWLTCLLIISEGLALGVSNGRWVTAAHLSKEIAEAVSHLDPQTTLVVNVPDNFQGAYIFRNGLTQAATYFVGKPKTHYYQILSRHEVHSLKDYNEIRFENHSLTLTLPPGRRFSVVHRDTPEISALENKLCVDLAKIRPAVDQLALYEGFLAGRPLVLVVRLRGNSTANLRELEREENLAVAKLGAR